VENAARRRRQLIEAALTSVVKNGLAGTTLATVAQEAGLSQGAAVFYFGAKQALLAEALKAHYQDYRDNWRAALDAAGGDPLARVAALMRADFDPKVCNPKALAIWHAFWGEASARPLYAAISEAVDAERAREICAALGALLTPEGWSAEEVERLAAGLDSLTDGLWLHLHLSPETLTAAEALDVAARFLAWLTPAHAEAIGRLIAAPPEWAAAWAPRPEARATPDDSAAAAEGDRGIAAGGRRAAEADGRAAAGEGDGR
jgi:AcrR family transcriptional regulator